MININSDMGEGFGIYKLGDDEALMPYITEANVACGFHASDPNHMKHTVELAKRYGVKVGAHFSLPDLQGFYRRKMHLSQAELHNMIVYQIGALKGFLDMLGMPLNHLKPHGVLYGMKRIRSRNRRNHRQYRVALPSTRIRFNRYLPRESIQKQGCGLRRRVFHRPRL